MTERAIELIVEAGFLPDGALQLIVGSTGDLLDRLGAHDVLAFTGSADTARGLRSRANLLAANTRVNVEADSLNAAVLGPDVLDGSATFGLFLKDVVREMTQKSGQKCTAVRRILVPARPRGRRPGGADRQALRGRRRQPRGPVGEDGPARHRPAAQGHGRRHRRAAGGRADRPRHRQAGRRRRRPGRQGLLRPADPAARATTPATPGRSTSARSSPRRPPSSPTTAAPARRPRSWPWAAARW